jgi:glycosyltransferase involved in cell wall biosynthesis
MGMAVISTSVGCAGLRCENNRNILIADTPQQFAEHIFSLVKDPSRRQHLGEEGRRTVEQYYSWDRSAQQIETLYRHYISQDNAHQDFVPSDYPAFAAASKIPGSETRNR